MWRIWGNKDLSRSMRKGAFSSLLLIKYQQQTVTNILPMVPDLQHFHSLRLLQKWYHFPIEKKKNETLSPLLYHLFKASGPCCEHVCEHLPVLFTHGSQDQMFQNFHQYWHLVISSITQGTQLHNMVAIQSTVDWWMFMKWLQ